MKCIASFITFFENNLHLEVVECKNKNWKEVYKILMCKYHPDTEVSDYEYIDELDDDLDEANEELFNMDEQFQCMFLEDIAMDSVYNGVKDTLSKLDSGETGKIPLSEMKEKMNDLKNNK